MPIQTQKQIKGAILAYYEQNYPNKVTRPSEINSYARKFHEILKVKVQTKSMVHVENEHLIMKWDKGKYTIGLLDDIYTNILQPLLLN